jgi:PleD family two-component response regulator
MVSLSVSIRQKLTKSFQITRQNIRPLAEFDSGESVRIPVRVDRHRHQDEVHERTTTQLKKAGLIMTMEFIQSTRPTSDPPRALVTLEHISDRRSMEAAFQRLGYNVRCMTDGHGVDALVRSFAPDIMIIDSRQVQQQSSALLLQVRRCPDILTIAVGADS